MASGLIRVITSGMSDCQEASRTLAKARPRNDLGHVFGPAHQRRAHFLLVIAAIVDAGDAGLVPASVIERGLNYMGKSPQVCHSRGRGPSQIVKPPRPDTIADALREREPPPHPGCEAVAGVAAEHGVTAEPPWRHPQDFERGVGQRQGVRSIIFDPGRRQDEDALREVDLAPSQLRDLVAPASGQDQQFDNAAEVIVRARVPNLGQLGVVEHALARR